MVLLAEFHALGPLVVALVQISGNAPELDQLVLLQLLCQGDVVKVVVGVNRCSQTLGGHGLSVGEGHGGASTGHYSVAVAATSASKRPLSTCSALWDPHPFLCNGSLLRTHWQVQRGTLVPEHPRPVSWPLKHKRNCHLLTGLLSPPT